MKVKKRRFISLFIAVIMLALPLNVFAASGLPSTTSITSGKCYYLRNAKSGHYLDAENSKNFNVIQYEQHGNYNQLWKITQISSNVFRLENQSPYYRSQGRKMLSVEENGSNADLFYYNSNLTTQQWRFTKNSDGTYTLKNIYANEVLGVQDGSTTSPCNVQRMASTGGAHQKWYLERVPELNSTLSALRTRFPQGKYWNHSPGTTSEPTSVRTIPCTHHTPCDTGSGSCGCNYFDAGIQCVGYARYIGKQLYGSSVRTAWTQLPTNTESEKVGYMSLIKPGDYIRYRNGKYYHSVLVIAVSPDTITVTDANSDGHCIINWNKAISRSTITANVILICRAPYILI